MFKKSFVSLSLLTLLGSLSYAQGIWISREEILSLPIPGEAGCEKGTLCQEAWRSVSAAAGANWGYPDLSEYGHKHARGVLAAAIVSTRLWVAPNKRQFLPERWNVAQKYYKRAVEGLMDVIGTERAAAPNPDGSGGKRDGSLAIARGFPQYVIAADIIGLYPDGKPESPGTTWGKYVARMHKAKFTFREGDGGHTFKFGHRCASNGCAMAGAANAVSAAYLKDQAELDEAWLYFRRYVGDTSVDADLSTPFYFSGSGKDWYHDDDNKLAINPKGARRGGYNVDGVIPNDQGRGGGRPWSSYGEPGYTRYPWEGLQGIYLQAMIFHRLGYKDPQGNDPWRTQDSALLRAIQYQWYLQQLFGGEWYDSSRAAWVKHLAKIIYGYKPMDYGTSGGRNMDFTQWTHQESSAPHSN